MVLLFLLPTSPVAFSLHVEETYHNAALCLHNLGYRNYYITLHYGLFLCMSVSISIGRELRPQVPYY